ncbi:MAG: PAS domain S-box protein, partial [Candidatus Aureabacteria bacterium]|nr:PAS domain S-box protein [Candidatus Auribacterota bacterium]
VDRSYIFLAREDERSVENTHEWCAKGIESQIRRLKNLSEKDFTWFAGRLRRKEIIHIPDINKIPREAVSLKKLQKTQKTKSFICVPMIYAGRLVGFLGFDSVLSKKKWEEKHINLLRIAGEIFANALVRKKVEKALKENEELYRTLVETSPDAIVVTDIHANILMVNPQAVSLFKIKSSQDVIGKNGFRYFARSDHERLRKNIQRLIKQGKLPNVEYTLRKNDGSFFAGDVSASVIRDAEEQQKGFMVVIRDITEKKRLEEEMAKSQKIESIGLLAGGIAHNFNNILTGILGNLSLAKMSVRTDDENHTILTDAERAAQQARSLTRQLLTFSRGGTPTRRITSMKELLPDAACLAFRGSNIECVLEIPPDLYHVNVDKGQITQVISNLLINAQQAMPEGGVIRIKAENIHIKKEKEGVFKAGRYVRIAVKDQGKGIPEDIAQKIFDPYFSTKKHGSGLGLTTAYSIIKKHDGHIDFESREGKGSTFILLLPATGRKVSDEKMEEHRPKGGRGKILLMDDEEVILKVTSRMLTHLGYDVTLARDGDEAVQIYEQAQKNNLAFDAVLMDLTVSGGMGGKEAVKEVKRIDPDAKVIVSSGYSNDPIISKYRDFGFSDVIAKPYRMEDLDRVLHRILDRK